MAGQYDSDEKFMEFLAYRALLILREKGDLKRGEVVAELKAQRLLEDIPQGLKGDDHGGRDKITYRLGATTDKFVKKGYMIKGGDPSKWQLTPAGLRALEGNDKLLPDRRVHALFRVAIPAEKRESDDTRKIATPKPEGLGIVASGHAQNNAAVIKHLTYTAMKILHKNGGKMLLSDLREEVEERKGDTIPAELRAVNRWGAILWQNQMEAAAHNKFVVPKFLKKNQGEWCLTAEGMALMELGNEAQVYAEARKARRRTPSSSLIVLKDNSTAELLPVSAQDENTDASSSLDLEGEDDDFEAVLRATERPDIGGYESTSKEEIKAHLQNMDPYDFQDLCAALLRGMGYHIYYIAPPGKDGGIDIHAYTDPLGAGRVRVQAKRYNDSTKVSAPEVRDLAGALKEGDIGVFITTSKYASGCEQKARESRYHINLIDVGNFINLWIEHYDKLSEEDKQRLPLRPIYFLEKK